MTSHNLGACRYPKFKKGQLVELSSDGYAIGLADYYASVFGKVVNLENGILTVLREGMAHPQDFHPCFWEPTTAKERKWADAWQKDRWKDQVAWDDFSL